MSGHVDPAPGPILRATKVTKNFGGLVAVREVDLEIPRGGIISLIGPNGAGKTTFFNIVAGVINPTGGTVELDGNPMIAKPVRAGLEPLVWVTPPILVTLLGLLAWTATGSIELAGALLVGAMLLLVGMLLAALVRPAWYLDILRRGGSFRSARPNDMVKAGIGRTFQNIRLFQNMTALENVLVGMHSRLRSNAADAMFSSPRARREERDAERAALDFLAMVGLKGRHDELAKNLPYGDQRRLELARALASKPALLLLDEPTAGMNPRETLELTALIGRLRRDLQLSILLIEHDMKVVMGISDRIYVLDHGDLIAAGSPAEVRANPRVIEAYLGQAPA